MRRTAMLSAIVLACVMLVSCSPYGFGKGPASGDEPPEPIEEPVIPVEVDTPRVGDISDTFRTTSRIEAERRVDVVAEAMGECVNVLVHEGDRVQKGQILAELDKEEARANLEQTRITVQQRQAEYQRTRQGYEGEISVFSKAELDAARFAFEQAEANQNTQQIQLNKLTIRAPMAGIVTQRNIQTGQYVSSGTPIFSIVDPTSYMLTINPPERRLPRLSVGQEARVVVDALGDREFAAHIRQINPAVDPATGTVTVKLDFSEDVVNELRVSAFVRVQLVIETHEDALLLPKDALVEENARKYVFVVEEALPDKENGVEGPAPSEETGAKAEATREPDKDSGQEIEKEQPQGPRLVARKVEVTTGFEETNVVEILSGVETDSLIVTMGQHTLKPGARVRPTNMDKELAEKAGLSVEQALEMAEAEREKEAEKNEALQSSPSPAQ